MSEVDITFSEKTVKVLQWISKDELFSRSNVHANAAKHSKLCITWSSGEFIAKDFKHFIRLSGMKHVRTSPHYSQGNGKIERCHRTIKPADSFRCRVGASVDSLRSAFNHAHQDLKILLQQPECRYGKSEANDTSSGQLHKHRAPIETTQCEYRD